eukprot:2215179-Pyramimonas_sp.AAC.1
MEKCRKARDFACETVSCTYACFKIAREMPKQSSLEGAQEFYKALQDQLTKKNFKLPEGLERRAQSKLDSFKTGLGKGGKDKDKVAKAAAADAP